MTAAAAPAKAAGRRWTNAAQRAQPVPVASFGSRPAARPRRSRRLKTRCPKKPSIAGVRVSAAAMVNAMPTAAAAAIPER